MPPFIFESAFLMRMPRVSAFLPEVTQQIHSLRAKGVISSHSARTAGVEVIAIRKSSGSLCTVPVASVVFLILFILPIRAPCSLRSWNDSNPKHERESLYRDADRSA